MKFPQFRKYKNGQSYFKIASENTFIEYKLFGKTLSRQTFEAKILPDRNYVKDMLFDYENYWDKIDEASFKAFLKSHEAHE